MKRISIRQAMIDAIEETDESLSRYPNQMIKWAKKIEKGIGSCLGYKVKYKAMTVNGCCIDLPEDCYRVIGVFPGNHEEECNIQYRNLSNPLIREDTINEDGVDVTSYWIPLEATWINEYFWEEVGDQLQMINKFNGQEVTLVYNYNETDEKGYWIVNESHIEAISKYIQYMFARKFKWKMFKSDKLLRNGHLAIVNGLENDYNTAVRNARAEDGKENPLEKSQL